MDIILQIPLRIIKEQELVIGPLAWDEVRKVTGLNVDLLIYRFLFQETLKML